MNSFINMKGCSSNNNINRNLIHYNQKMLIHVDISGVSLCNSVLISNEEMHAENQEHSFTNLFNLFMSLTDKQICFHSQ